MVPHVEGQALPESVDECGSVLIEKGDESDRPFLRSLRGGPMDHAQVTARWSNNGPQLSRLLSAGLVAREGDSSFQITDKGRAMCPPRNPASGPSLSMG